MPKVKFILYLCCIILGACASNNGYEAQKNIHELASSSFKVQKYYTSTFTLHGLLRQARGPSEYLHVYIEGDGLAWISRTRPSKNPTPTDSVTQDLAKHNPSDAAVLYLARPCQYVESDDMRMCNQKFWTSHRLAPEVITALNEAITQAKQYTKAKHISIVGYSGGGGAAVLVAAKRNDVSFLGSVAGMLDHERWTKMHKVSPLNGSLNPVDSVQKVKYIPQRHLSSNADKIVPPSTQAAYCKELKNTEFCVNVNTLKHSDNWYKFWDYNTP